MGRDVKTTLSCVVAAGLVLSGAAAADAQTVGDWVLGNWQGAGYWYPGVVEKVGGGNVTIVYDDGDRETVGFGEVRPYDWKIGKKVECDFKGAGEWYPGKIASLGGERLVVTYDDGDKETTRTGRCRSR